MSHFEMAECPQCGKTAYGRTEIDELFGYRYEGTTPQSWCKECRSAGSRCGYTDCPKWGEDYPACRNSLECPLYDN